MSKSGNTSLMQWRQMIILDDFTSKHCSGSRYDAPSASLISNALQSVGLLNELVLAGVSNDPVDVGGVVSCSPAVKRMRYGTTDEMGQFLGWCITTAMMFK